MDSYKIQISKSFRKTLSMRFDIDWVLQVKVPFFTSQKQINNFIEKHTHWTQKHKKFLEQRSLSENQIHELKDAAKKYIPTRVQYLAYKYDFKYLKIRITSARTRFGSCSSKKTLNFSYRLMQYRKECIDYVIIHELCHLRHMNHSRDFWKEVESIMPNYKKWQKILKN